MRWRVWQGYGLQDFQFILFCVFLQSIASERAHSIFGTLDLDGDGEITEEEFVKGCMEDSDFVETLSGDKNDSEEADDEQNNFYVQFLQVDKNIIIKNFYTFLPYLTQTEYSFLICV